MQGFRDMHEVISKLSIHSTPKGVVFFVFFGIFMQIMFWTWGPLKPHTTCVALDRLFVVSVSQWAITLCTARRKSKKVNHQ